MRQAAEFLSKKDYTDNWMSEMNEEFCFWSFAQWKAELAMTGIHLIENPNNTAEGSRVYTSPWIVANRHAGHVEITSILGQPERWPPTNMVLVAEKR